MFCRNGAYDGRSFHTFRVHAGTCTCCRIFRISSVASVHLLHSFCFSVIDLWLHSLCCRSLLICLCRWRMLSPLALSLLWPPWTLYSLAVCYFYLYCLMCTPSVSCSYALVDSPASVLNHWPLAHRQSFSYRTCATRRRCVCPHHMNHQSWNPFRTVHRCNHFHPSFHCHWVAPISGKLYAVTMYRRRRAPFSLWFAPAVGSFHFSRVSHSGPWVADIHTNHNRMSPRLDCLLLHAAAILCRRRRTVQYIHRSGGLRSDWRIAAKSHRIVHNSCEIDMTLANRIGNLYRFVRGVFHLLLSGQWFVWRKKKTREKSNNKPIKAIATKQKQWSHAADYLFAGHVPQLESTA